MWFMMNLTRLLQARRHLTNDYLSSLPKINRLVFVGRYWQFESIDNISKHLGISQSKTKSILFRARKGLREYLIKEGFVL